ncbi:glutaminase A [Pseudalkalibacillus caeni]|uniref:Glutaminase n=1 Tax=Exobacillus caeni TaxID=2574798 RepID=A0A5R9F3Q5_9BACL|nr:glutaminase A [Pseudalkalibacillus caeni]TLS38322.1 glutaminase A [Pseudalkalibacillus caeni]
MEITREYLQTVVNKCKPFSANGSVKQYIPGLDNSNQNDLGITVITLDGQTVSAGETDLVFTLQSVSKTISLMVALQDFGKEAVFQKVGMEPTDDFFNSIANLETYQQHKPYNPFINSGAIAVASMINGNNYLERFERILELVRKITNNPSVSLNKDVLEAEKRNGARNRSLAYYMESTGALDKDRVEDALELYFRINSINVTTHDLAKLGCFFANEGVSPHTGEKHIDGRHIRTIKALMMTSGMYNESGEFTVEAGIPAKSGICGSIMAAVPGKMGIGIIGPGINKKGNSLAGGKMLKLLSQDLQLNMFHKEIHKDR